MKPTHGDKRKTSGRKPVADKNVQVSFYIEQSKIEKLGVADTFKTPQHPPLVILCVNHSSLLLIKYFSK